MGQNNSAVSVFYTIWGHKSIGNAVEDALAKKHKVFSNFIKLNSVSVKPYNAMYIFFPHLSGIPYKISESSKNISNIVEKYLTNVYLTKIEKLIAKQKPAYVVSVYFAFNFALTKLAKKYGFVLINIVADPRTFHRLVTPHNAYNFVFDNKSRKRCLHNGIVKDKIIQSGWFVRKEFQEPYDKYKVRKYLGLSPDKFTISIIGGSEGTLNILKILPAFTDIKQDVQVIFICGNNKSLYKSLSVFQRIHNLSNGSNVSFFIKGFTTNTHKYLQASDLVIGKAGPNLLFESVATQTPFFAISHISGQEDGNLEIIKEYKLGFVEERPMKAIKLTKKIIANPDILKRFQKSLQKLADYNSKSYLILNNFIESGLKNYEHKEGSN